MAVLCDLVMRSKLTLSINNAARSSFFGKFNNCGMQQGVIPFSDFFNWKFIDSTNRFGCFFNYLLIWKDEAFVIGDRDA